jgi:hypothetical protein
VRAQAIFEKNIDRHYFGVGERTLAPLHYSGAPGTFSSLADCPPGTFGAAQHDDDRRAQPDGLVRRGKLNPYRTERYLRVPMRQPPRWTEEDEDAVRTRNLKAAEDADEAASEARPWVGRPGFSEDRFWRDCNEALSRIKRIDALAASSALAHAFDMFFKHMRVDAIAPPTRGVSGYAFIDTIIAELERTRSFELPYAWVAQHQGDADYEAAKAAEATARTSRGRFWSKLSTRRAHRGAQQNEGLYLESSVAGVLLNGLKFGKSGWGWSANLSKLWDELSAHYAAHLHGVIEADVLDGMDPRSVLTTTEWDHIKTNLEAGKLKEFRIQIWTEYAEGITRRLAKKGAPHVITVANIASFTELPKAPNTALWYQRQGRINTMEPLFERLDDLFAAFRREKGEDATPTVEDMRKLDRGFY